MQKSRYLKNRKQIVNILHYNWASDRRFCLHAVYVYTIEIYITNISRIDSYRPTFFAV